MRQKAGAVETHFVRVECGCQCMIGAGRTESRDTRAFFFTGMTQKIFELANLIAAIQVTSEVVLL